MITLNTEALALIRADKKLQLKIQTILEVTERTMYTYLKNGSPEFTRLDIINEIVIYTDRPLSELITGGKLSKLVAK